MSDPDAAFAALGDRTRRTLLAEVAAADGITATELAKGRDVSRQAVVKHLQVLAAAGLVEAERVGREQRYRLAAAPFAGVAEWLGSVGAAWDERLARLAERHRR